MGGFVFFLVVLAIVIVGNLAKKARNDTSRTRPGPRIQPGPPAAGMGVPMDPREAVDEVRSAITQVRDDPAVQAFLPDVDDAVDPTSAPATPSVLSEPSRGRYVGSAALESSLDSTIDSSLLGMPESPTVTMVAAGGRRIDLADEVAGQVVAFVSDGHEVAAVRLICDSTGCGILDAMRTVEAYR